MSTGIVLLKTLRVLLYVVYLGAFALAVDYFVFWRPFVAELRETKRPNRLEISPVGAVTKELMQLVGTVSPVRESSFSHFAQQKREGVTRVCAYGDSFTYGDEVAERADYPSRLDHALRKLGVREVEVLNFGSSWYGFHQSFVLWEETGKRYGCDVTLIGPASFWEGRDTTFNHGDLTSPYYLHARYVLDGDGVRRIDVPGDDFGDRFDRYWSFFPRWQYLRYDRSAPAFLRAMLPKGRTLRNPFYYRRNSQTEESIAIWQTLIKRMADRGPVVLSALRDDVVEAARSVENENLVTVSAWQDHRFPYRARQGHFSVWGNQLIAAQFGAQLLGKDRALCAQGVDLACSLRPQDAVRLVTSGHAEGAASVHVKARRTLSDYSTIGFQIDGKNAGVLVTTSTNFWARGQGTMTDFHNSTLKSLLAIVSPSESLVDAAYLPLFFPLDSLLKQGEHLRVGFGNSEFEGKRTTQLKMRRIHPMLPIGIVETGSLEFRDKEELVWRAEEPLPPDGVPVEISLGGHLILSGSVTNGEAVLGVDHGKLLQVTAIQSEPFDVAALPQSGSVDLVLEHPQDGLIRIPLSRWKKAPIRFSE